MDDQQLLQHGLARIEDLLQSLQPAVRKQLNDQLDDCRLQKILFADIVASVGSAQLCGACRGRCCMNGKYRLSVFDALLICSHKQALRADFPQKPLCPYGTTGGCFFEAQFRPLDCVLFSCDTVNECLTETEKTSLVIGEIALRDSLKNTENLLCKALATPLLLWAERNQILT